MLTEFASWYAERMGELLPAAVSRAASPDGLVAVADRLDAAPAFTWRVRQRGREVAVTDPGARAWPDIALRVPPGALLERVVTLPLAADAGLARVIGFEMDRYTPFAAEEVFWSATVIERQRELGRLRARICLLQRGATAAALASLGARGLTATAIEAVAPDGGLRRIALREEGGAERAGRRRLAAMLVLAAVLAVAAVGLPFLRQSWTADAVEAQIAALQPAVTEADALRRRLLAQSAGSDAIAGEEIRIGEPLQAISALTELLPDDTFLTGLAIHLRQVTIDGQSASAARLIGLLSADPVIRNAAFAAPVTRGEDGQDVFSIKADIRS